MQSGAQLRAPTVREFPIPHQQSPQHPGLPLTWGRPAEAGLVLTGQERMAGCAGCESSAGLLGARRRFPGAGVGFKADPCAGSHSACIAGRAVPLQGCAPGAWLSWGFWGVPAEWVLLSHHVVPTAAPHLLLLRPPRAAPKPCPDGGSIPQQCGGCLGAARSARAQVGLTPFEEQIDVSFAIPLGVKKKKINVEKQI